MTDNPWIVLRRLAARLRGLTVVLALAQATVAQGAGPDLSAYQDLKRIGSFGAITVSLHNPVPAAAAEELTEQSLSDYVRERFQAYFPGLPYRDASPAELADAGNAQSLGVLACRVWIDNASAPAVFQVRCAVSTAEHRNIIEDGSYGYGPSGQVAEVIRRQIDHILGGFGGVMARLRNEG
jgi:hypothetical protein